MILALLEGTTLSLYWTPSIDAPETSSGGRYNLRFATPSAHVMLTRPTSADPDAITSLQGTVAGGGYGLSFQSTDTNADALLRLLAHCLVAVVPSGGLPETCTSLSEIYNFHTENEALALGHGSSGDDNLHTVGRLGNVGERAPFAIGD